MTDGQESSSLLSDAKNFRDHGFKSLALSGDKKPIRNTIWTDKRGEGISPQTDVELESCFSNIHAKCLGIILDSGDRLAFATDIDGTGWIVFQNKILGRCSKDLQNAFNKTTHTKSPHGYHFIFRIKRHDFPEGIGYLECWSDNRGNKNHNEIVLLGTKSYLAERGPGYESIRGIEHIITLSKEFVEELQSRFKQYKLETNAIKTVSSSLKSFYHSGNRNNLIFALSGFLHKNLLPVNLILDTIEYLIDFAGTDTPEEREERIRVAKSTCVKDPNNGEVSGRERLAELLDNNAIEELIHVFKQLGKQIGQDYFPSVHVNDNDCTVSDADPDVRRLPFEVQTQLSAHIYSLIGRNPLKFYVADEQKKEIIKVVVSRPRDVTETLDSEATTTTTTTKTKTIKYMEKDVMIDAIPKKVIINDNALDGTKTYQVTFEHKRSKPFTVGPGSISFLLEELETKGRLVAARDSKQALTAILVKYEDSGKADITNKPPQTGYFWIDKKIVGYDVTQRDIDPANNDEDRIKIRECIDVIEGLYTRNKNKAVFITILKWAVLTPFGYVKKCIDDRHSNWLPDMQAFGQPRTGKNTLGMYVLAIWRLHGSDHFEFHVIGFGSADTKAKLARAVSRTTYPININEVGALRLEKYYDIVELEKTKIESRIIRGAHREIHRFVNTPALSNLILTGNSPPPDDLAYRIRVCPLPFDTTHCSTDEEKVKFEEWFYTEKKIDELGMLGDFATKYITANPEQTLRDLRWNEAGKLILTEFYMAVGRKPPEWLDLLEKPNLLDDNKEQTYFRLKALFEQAILEGYRRDCKDHYNMEVPFESKLEKCLNNRSVSFLTKRNNKDGKSDIAITYSIMDLLPKHNISDIGTLEALAGHISGFKAKTVKLGDKSAKACNGSYDDFRKFLGCRNEEVAGVKDTISNSDPVNAYFKDGTWHCKSCETKGDKWFIMDHKCGSSTEGLKKNDAR